MVAGSGETNAQAPVSPGVQAQVGPGAKRNGWIA